MSKPHIFHDLDADVIIIGAGVAGLTTAYALFQKEPSLNITILEATDKVGGRTMTTPLLVANSAFKPFDEGGQWISSQQTVLLDLLEELDIQLDRRMNTGKIIVNVEGKVFRQNRNNPFGFSYLAAKLELAAFAAKIEHLCLKESVGKELTSTNMQDFINEHLTHDVNRMIVRSLILMHCGVDAQNITVAFYIFFCTSTHGITNQLDLESLHEFNICNGAEKICNKISALLQDDISLVTNTRVSQITRNKDYVEIVTNLDTLYSSNVVVAVPPPAISRINFVPPLPPPKLRALHSVVCGDLWKFVATYEYQFWCKKGVSGDIYVLDGHCPQCPVICCFNNVTQNHAALCGFFTPTDSETQKLLLEELAQYLGAPTLHPLQMAARRWPCSPTCCLSSYEDVENMRCRTERIFWAGAETSSEWYGTICGAVISGYRAATEVLYDMRPAVLTIDDMNILRTNLSTIKKSMKMHNNIYRKIVTPHYQVSTFFVALLLVVVWRKFNLNTYLRNILIK